MSFCVQLMSVCTKFCVEVFHWKSDNLDDDDVDDEDMESLKSLGFNLYDKQNVIVIHLMFVKLFNSGQRRDGAFLGALYCG